MATKRKTITFGRVFKNGFINFLRNAWLASAAIAVMVITLTIFLLSYIASTTFNNSIDQLTDKIDISVYLVDGIKEEDLNNFFDDLKGLDSVKSIDYLSKEKALDEYKSQNKDNLDLLSAISQTDNPLPATVRVKPVDPDHFEEIKVFLETPDNQKLQSEETSYSGDRKEAIDNITSATEYFRTAGIVGVATFAVISVLIIFNTIRMAIFNRRDEINIMRLLGAGTWYIRGPFIVETVFYGVISGLLSVIITSLIFSIQTNALDATSLGLLDIGFASEYFSDNFFKILTIQIGIGITIGAISSFIATRKYLKFKPAKN
ncbi:MAG: ABC transporter permease [bacterium]|nr:ABC transporter permease [bacterium]